MWVRVNASAGKREQALTSNFVILFLPIQSSSRLTSASRFSIFYFGERHETRRGRGWPDGVG